jgi:heme/copper-type cytochrome/quinol oxidase subunit 1
MNLTFMPMHWSGLLGMPRRTWVYDAGQGLEVWNLMSSVGAYIQVAAVLVGFYNLIRAWRSGPAAGNDPWGAPTLEWSIPSPPPEYNFATIPTVTSRYPLWDRKSPEPGAPGARGGMSSASPQRIPSAKELGIPMPNPSIWPLLVALFMTLMFACLLLIHKGKTQLAIAGIITCATLMTISLYSWLLTPLEDEH